MKNKKLLISSCIFVLLFAVTFGILFLTYSVDDLLLCLKMIKSTSYLIIGIAIVIFFTLEAIYFKIIFKYYMTPIIIIKLSNYFLTFR